MDSSVAYSWIVNTSKIFPVFIQKRAKEVRNLVDVACFKLIDMKRNPADIVSRWVKPAELLSNRLYFSIFSVFYSFFDWLYLSGKRFSGYGFYMILVHP